MDAVKARAQALDSDIKRIIFSDPVQVRGLWMHHGVCAINMPKNKAGERKIWIVRGFIGAMERELARLVRRHARDPVTHRAIWAFFQDSGAVIFGVPEAEARENGILRPSADPNGCTDDDHESTLMMRFEYKCDEMPQLAFIASMTWTQPYCEHAMWDLYTRDVPASLAPVLCRETTQAMFARANESAVIRHLQAYYLTKGAAVARHAGHDELCVLAQTMLDTMPRVCDACGQSARHVCPGCRIIRYCSPACQRKAWRTTHKRACRVFRDLIDIAILRANTPRSPA